jgi:histidinol dehydrogenase
MNILDWEKLDSATRKIALERPPQSRAPDLIAGVTRILDQVRADGDSALRALTRRYDNCELSTFAVSPEEFDAAEAELPIDLKNAIAQAHTRIDRFHRATAPQALRVETAPGVVCERVLRPIGHVGLYVPAGSAPLPSTALMLGVPAHIAQCAEIAMCTPASASGRCDSAVLYAASLCGVREVFKLGGAQAIAALAFGTASIPKCDKIFGPGNAWVAEAKRQIAADANGAAIDLPAGPSEVLVIADAQSDAGFVAADLLAQAEHGPDSQTIVVSDSVELLRAVSEQLATQIESLPRADIARQSIAHARLIFVPSIEKALAVSNAYAPEHLILNVAHPRSWLDKVENAGSVFLGAWSPEAVGDYCSGTNHVLPTYGHARAWSGVSVASFLKQITVQELTSAGLAAIGPCAAALARAEGLVAHERAVIRRLDALAETP